jgi:hypothetical protein
MSFSWFVGLHFPLLIALCNGNTTLAWSIWPASHFDQPEPEDEPHSNLMAPMSYPHPTPQSAWYVVGFFALLVATWVLYFTAALSYPGFVDEEYKKHISTPSSGGRSSLSGRSRRAGRNGYARVGTQGGEDHVEEEHEQPEVRMDMRATTHRVQVAPVEESRIDPAVSRLRTTSFIPISAVGESVEAAELSIGCTPPVAQPILQSLGLSRSQIHAQDQTAEEDSRNPHPSEVVNGEEETSRLTNQPPAGDVEMTTRGSSGANGTTNGAQTNGSASSNSPSRVQTGTAGYCTMCNLVRPARAKHCYKCRHCVAKFDHHCPFVANCIGFANHRYFLAYLWSQVLMMLWAIALNVEPYFFQYNAKEFYGHAFVMIIMLGQLMVSGMLCMFHTWLSWTNQTTYQVIKIQEQGLAQSPHAREARREERRRENRRMGEHEDQDLDTDVEAEDDTTTAAAEARLSWRTYHVGFVRNVWKFWTAQMPQEHRLPRSILADDGSNSGRRWIHLPHAVSEVEPLPPPPVVPRLADLSSSNDSTARSTVVNLRLEDGRSLPQTASELASFTFPDTPPIAEPREAYTRPVKILSKASQHAVSAANGASVVGSSASPSRKPEPDTDEEVDERTDSIAL